MGHLISLVYNFTASDKGCKIPMIPTLLGPKRICIYPKIFRSKRVINATLTSDIISIITHVKIWSSNIEI